MSDFTLSIQDIHSIIDKISQTNLDCFELKTQDFKLKLSKNNTTALTTDSEQTILTRITNCASTEPSICTTPVQEVGHIVTSPIVGTFYSSPSPDKPAFVQVGDCVTPSTVLFIIESMKLMNEIFSEFSGSVVEILVKNGDCVEFGQPIMRIH